MVKRTLAAATVLALVVFGEVPAATLQLSVGQLSIDQHRQIASYPAFDTIAFGSVVRIPAGVFYVELLPEEHSTDVRFTIDHATELTGVALSNDNREIPTSSGELDRSGIRSSAQETAIGVNPVVLLGETEVLGMQYAKLLITPMSLDADQQWQCNDAITIRVQSREIAPNQLIAESEFAALFSNRDAERHVAHSSEAPEMLIVTSADLAEPMSRLAEYRTATGIQTEVNFIDYILPSSSGQDDAEKLREFLKGFYANGGRYVLLAGDETILPIRYTYHLNTDSTPALIDQIPSDLYFGDLTGNWDADGDGIWGERSDDLPDLTPELMVGRLPIATVAEANAYVDNLILYETNPGKGDRSYLTRAFFFSSDEMRDYGVTGQHSLIAASYPINFTIDTVHGVESTSGGDPSPVNESGAEVMNDLDNGFGIVNIIAHGRMDGFEVRTSGYNNYPKSMLASAAAGDHGDIGNLSADGKLGFYYSLACDIGGYDEDEPPIDYAGRNFAQEALTIPQAGAVGFVAYSRWGWVSSSFLLHKAFFDSLFAHPGRPAIEAMHAAAARYSFYRDLVYGQNFYGDPSLIVYTAQPQPLAISIETENQTTRVRVTANGAPVPNSSVIVSESWNIVGRYTTDADGWVTIANELSLGTHYLIAATKTNSMTAMSSFTPSLLTDTDDSPQPDLPTSFALAQNYPNPFNPTTTISYSLPTRSYVNLSIYNTLGQEVAVLENGTVPAGSYAVVWDGKNNRHGEVASGVYFYRLVANDYVDVRSMVLIR